MPAAGEMLQNEFKKSFLIFTSCCKNHLMQRFTESGSSQFYAIVPYQLAIEQIFLSALPVPAAKGMTHMTHRGSFQGSFLCNIFS